MSEEPSGVRDPFQLGDEWREQIDELMKRQGGKCGGCQIPLSSIGSGEGDEPEKLRAEREAVKLDPNVARMGWIDLRTPRRLKGKEVPSNRWLLCTDCLGSTTVNIRLPDWLLNKSKNYRKKNPEFKFITQLMRAALEHYISSEDEQKEKAKMAERELELKVFKWIDSMPEQLTRFSPTDIHESGAASEVKSKKQVPWYFDMWDEEWREQIDEG